MFQANIDQLNAMPGIYKTKNTVEGTEMCKNLQNFQQNIISSHYMKWMGYSLFFKLSENPNF